MGDETVRRIVEMLAKKDLPTNRQWRDFIENTYCAGSAQDGR